MGKEGGDETLPKAGNPRAVGHCGVRGHSPVLADGRRGGLRTIPMCAAQGRKSCTRREGEAGLTEEMTKSSTLSQLSVATHTFIIPKLKNQRQEDDECKQSGLYSETLLQKDNE